jgi:hypothetical protein
VGRHLECAAAGYSVCVGVERGAGADGGRATAGHDAGRCAGDDERRCGWGRRSEGGAVRLFPDDEERNCNITLVARGRGCVYKLAGAAGTSDDHHNIGSRCCDGVMRPIFSQLKQVSLSVMKNSGYLEEAAVCLLSYRLQGSIQSLNA